MKNSANLAKKLILPLAILGSIKYRHKLKGLLMGSAVAVGTLASVQASAAIDETAVHNFAAAIEKAANAKNINQIARLIGDDAIISMSRQGRGTTTLYKSDYLQLLQKSWTESTGYRFNIQIQNIVIAGDIAKVQMITTETWQNSNDKPVTLITTSRANIGMSGSQAVLLHSVAQVTLN